jgi:hypothetical protein
MSHRARHCFVLAATMLGIASAAALALLPPSEVMSIHRTPLSEFVQPGVIVWWFVLAPPFSYAPSSSAEIALIAATNTALWLLVLWFVVVIVRGSVTRKWFFIAAPVLAIASTAALALISSAEVIPSIVRNPFSDFVEPGVTVWWFALGGLFSSTPSSPAGIAFAAAANAVFWLFLLWLVTVIVRTARRKLMWARS